MSLMRKLHEEQLDDRSRRAQEQMTSLETAINKLSIYSQASDAWAPLLAPHPSIINGQFSQKSAKGDGKFFQEAQEDPGRELAIGAYSSMEALAGDEDVKAIRTSLKSIVGWTTEKQQPFDQGAGAVSSSMSSNALFVAATEGRSPFHNFLVKVVHSTIFDSITALVVITNIFMLGLMVDLDLRRALDNDSSLEWETPCNMVFTVLFAIEALLRLASDRCFYFKGTAKWWNLFDVVVVVSGIVEGFDVTDMNLSPIRLLKLLRLLRILRIIRVFRFFRKLRMMALSMLACWGSLSWACVLMFIVLYTFAMVLMEGAREYVRMEPASQQDEVNIMEPVRRWWSTLPRTLYTLAQVVSGGVSWADPAIPFDHIGAAYSLIFTLFVAFVLFGLLNVLVGLFVQSTAAIADYDREFVIQEEMENQTSMMNKMRELFVQVDTDNSGTITWQELKDNMGADCVKAYFSLVEIDVHEAQGLFHLLDVDESGEVGIEEFIMGCMRLKGTAKSIDLATLLYENKRLHTMIRKFMQSTDKNMIGIFDLLNGKGARRLQPITMSNTMSRTG